MCPLVGFSLGLKSFTMCRENEWAGPERICKGVASTHAPMEGGCPASRKGPCPEGRLGGGERQGMIESMGSIV